MESKQYEKMISEYKTKFAELDKAIAARDKVIENMRKEVSKFKNRFYDMQNENDDLNEHIESLRNMNNHNVNLHQKNMNKLKEEIETNNAAHKSEITKLQSSKNVVEEKLTHISQKLEIAQNVIAEQKETINCNTCDFEVNYHRNLK